MFLHFRETSELFNELHPDWLPTQNLGPSKECKKRVQIREDRYQRKKARTAATATRLGEVALPVNRAEDDEETEETCPETAVVPNDDTDSANLMEHQDTSDQQIPTATTDSEVQTDPDERLTFLQAKIV